MVITPEALKRSNFKAIPFKDLPNTDCDEVFYFRYPSPDMVNEINGDGDLMEVHDYCIDPSKLFFFRGELAVTPETVIYVR